MSSLAKPESENTSKKKQDNQAVATPSIPQEIQCAVFLTGKLADISNSSEPEPGTRDENWASKEVGGNHNGAQQRGERRQRMNISN